MGARIFADFIEFIEGFEFHFLVKDVKRMGIRFRDTKHLHVNVPKHIDIETARSFVIRNMDWVRNTSLKLIEREKQKSKFSKFTPEDITKFTNLVSQRFSYWKMIMKVPDYSWKYSLMKSQWGSCNNRTNVIHLNLALAKFPEYCLDYVIIHELAHIEQPDHSIRFWNIVEKYCPDWKSIRKELRSLSLS